MGLALPVKREKLWHKSSSRTRIRNYRCLVFMMVWRSGQQYNDGMLVVLVLVLVLLMMMTMMKMIIMMIGVVVMMMMMTKFVVEDKGGDFMLMRVMAM